MRKILTSWAVRSLLFLAGFVFAVDVLRQMSVTFNFYLAELLGNFLAMKFTVALISLVICLALLILAVLWTKRSARSSVLARVDSALVLFFMFFSGFLGYEVIMRTSSSSAVLFFAALAYVIGLGGFLELLLRLRNQTLGSTFYWRDFFKHYHLRTPMGAMMAVLLAGNLSYFTLGVLSWVITPLRRIPTANGTLILRRISVDAHAVLHNTWLALFLAFVLAALTYFAVFVLHLSKEYEAVNQEKIRAERFKAELITNVSHDMKTPLTSIINYVGLLKNLPIEQAQFSDYVGILEEKSLRLKRLIADVLEASKVGTGNVAMYLQTVNLTEMLGQVLGEFDEDFTAKNLILVYRQPDEAVNIQADVEHLYRVLENLLSNALKYTLTGTRVFATLSVSSDSAKLQLANTSKTPIELTGVQLTEQFIRGDKARQTEGSGLGLYIAKSLVELMNAEFDIRIIGDLFEVDLEFKREK
jgi:signal transduction histidine kinase